MKERSLGLKVTLHLQEKKTLSLCFQSLLSSLSSICVWVFLWTYVFTSVLCMWVCVYVSKWVTIAVNGAVDWVYVPCHLNVITHTKLTLAKSLASSSAWPRSHLSLTGTGSARVYTYTPPFCATRQRASNQCVCACVCVTWLITKN